MVGRAGLRSHWEKAKAIAPKALMPIRIASNTPIRWTGSRGLIPPTGRKPRKARLPVRPFARMIYRNCRSENFLPQGAMRMEPRLCRGRRSDIAGLQGPRRGARAKLMNINTRRATKLKGIFARFDPPAPKRLSSTFPNPKQFRQRLLAKGLFRCWRGFLIYSP